MRITIGAIGTKPIIAAGDQYPTVDKPIANLELDSGRTNGHWQALMPNSKTGKFFNRPPSAAASDDWATVISGVEGPLRIQPPISFWKTAAIRTSAGSGPSWIVPIRTAGISGSC